MMIIGQSPCQDSGLRRVLLKQNLSSKGWNSHVRWEFPGKLESTNLGSENATEGRPSSLHAR